MLAWTTLFTSSFILCGSRHRLITHNSDPTAADRYSTLLLCQTVAPKSPNPNRQPASPKFSDGHANAATSVKPTKVYTNANTNVPTHHTTPRLHTVSHCKILLHHITSYTGSTLLSQQLDIQQLFSLKPLHLYIKDFLYDTSTPQFRSARYQYITQPHPPSQHLYSPHGLITISTTFYHSKTHTRLQTTSIPSQQLFSLKRYIHSTYHYISISITLYTIPRLHTVSICKIHHTMSSHLDNF